jgi:hypothetical protein
MWKTKDNMEVGNIQQFAFTFHYPSLFGYLLAFGAMPVAATVVAVLLAPAFFAF